LVTSTTAPVSAGLLKGTDRYFQALSAYRNGDARPIVEQFAAASRFAATAGARLIDDLAAQIEQSRDQMSLVDAGVLEERTGLRRNRVWQHTGILGVLDHVAQSRIRA
jgi:hypothetical protein